jgi:enoyl-CoA hydratase/carnithine racemase
MGGILESSRDGHVALLRLNRPEARNALSPEMMELIASTLEELDPDPDVRCIVIAGSDKVFAAGADIKAMSERSFADALRHPAAGFWRRVAAVKTPLVAAVSGFALGGGCELALACDIRVASERARFGQPEINLGIIPGWGGSQRLTRLVSPGYAKEMILTGAPIDAAEALRVGLVNHVHPAGELLDRAVELAATIAAKPVWAAGAAKEMCNRALDGDLAGGLAREIDVFALAFTTPDQREGMDAFFEKRPPKFG